MSIIEERFQKIIDIAKRNNGIITAAEVRYAGISPSYLVKMVEDGCINRLERGLYAFHDVYVDEMYELYFSNKGIVFSHLSALYLHNLTDRTPTKMTITIKRTKNASKLLKLGLVNIKRSNEKTHNMGLVTMLSPAGFSIPVYDMERTICDLVRAKKQTEPQILVDALKDYSKRKDKNLTRLAMYSKILKVENEIRQYVEVLL